MAVDLSDVAALRRQAMRLPQGADWKASPLPRTMDTATALLGHRPAGDIARISIEPRDRLKEQSFGDWVGRPRLSLRNDHAFKLYMTDPVHVAPTNGENLAVFSHRVEGDIAQIIQSKPEGGDCVIVAHAGTIRAAVSLATGLPMNDLLRRAVTPLSLSVIAYDPDKKAHGKNPWTLESMNLTP